MSESGMPTEPVLTHADHPAGVGTAIAVQGAADGQLLCAQGNHAWMPWLRITDRSWITYCCRCRKEEQFDSA